VKRYVLIRTVIFDMGGTLLRFARPGSGSWRELETPGIRSLYRYLIDQGHPYRLRDESAARAFNASLPCRADLIHLEHEVRTVLASFRLRRGPGGPCTGVVKVRYTIRDGKFMEWRQLPSKEPPAGDPA
jgi:hypothetical protein